MIYDYISGHWKLVSQTSFNKPTKKQLAFLKSRRWFDKKITQRGCFVLIKDFSTPLEFTKEEIRSTQQTLI